MGSKSPRVNDAYLGVKLPHEEKKRLSRIAKEKDIDRKPAELARRVLVDWMNQRERQKAAQQ
jgi:predicted transcriptional regulator